ncbi:MAG: hypothetical protein NTW29_16545 [Bacteroidetes bacterium]|nr:hypothetical protein [Bacteroidota bacterium]
MNKKDLPALWDDTKEFLRTFTTADISNPSFLTLKIYPIFDRKKFDKNLTEIIEASEKPNLEPIWNVANENLEKVMSGLQNVQKYMPTQLNAIELRVWYNFKFVDPVSSQELPNQESKSHINFIFSKRHSCSPCLVFPFTEPTQQFWGYLDTLIPKLPFQLNEKLLRKVFVKNERPSSFKKIIRTT